MSVIQLDMKFAGMVKPRFTGRGVGKLVKYAAACCLALGLGGGLGWAVNGGTYAGPVISYTVVPGDTVWDIARALAPDRPVREVVNQISELNGLTGGSIVVGQNLVIPAK